MAYSDFTLKKVKSELDIKLVEKNSVFSHIRAVEISTYLKDTLKRNIPLALAINTEKARSELIIINMLMEIKEKFSDKISLFSGIDFNVDKEKGLTGFCDFIISNSPEQFYLDSPVIAITEAKNENIISGLGQCIAEMYASRIYNEKEGYDLPSVYGAVTTGDEWKFIKLINDTAYIDTDNYYINDVEKIIGILTEMVQQKA
ncbi:MAG: hypothetical protein BWK80_01460 [Desulfobacteraceae bacterium IS3]|nr:MAG: hypothetical protein BWK80_01460 [Desulfobacteraceae bacterium IS3]